MKRWIEALLCCLFSLSLSAQNNAALLRSLERETIAYAQKKDADPNVIAEAYNKIAKLYFSQREYDAAQKAFEKELTARLKIEENANSLPAKAKVYYNLASLRRLLGDYAQGFQYASTALSLTEKHYGNKHQETADAQKQLAEIAYFWKRPLLYRKHCDAAIQIQERIKPLVVAKIADLLILDAGGYIELGDYESGEKKLLEALRLSEPLAKENPELLAKLYNNLGALRGYQDRYAEALQFSKKALDLRLSAGSEQQTGIAWLYDNIGVHYQKLHQIEEAIINYRKGLQLYSDLVGVEHPKTAEVMTHLAAALFEKKEYKEAENILTKAIQVFERSKNVGVSGAYFFALQKMANLEEELKNTSLAERYWLSAAEAMQQQYGNKHPDVAALFHSLSAFYQRRQEPITAKVFLHKALAANRISTKISDKKLWLQCVSELLLSYSDPLPDSIYALSFQAAKALLSEYRQDADQSIVLTDLHRFYEAVLYSYNRAEETWIKPNTSGPDFSYIMRCFEWSKSASLSASLSMEEAMRRLNVPEPLRQRYRYFKSTTKYFEQQWLQSEIAKDSLDADYFRKEASLYADSLKHWEQQLQQQFPKLDFEMGFSDRFEKAPSLQNLLAKDEGLLNYFFGERHAFLLYADKNGVQMQKIDFRWTEYLPLFLENFYREDISILDQEQVLKEYLDYGKHLSHILLPRFLDANHIKMLTIIPDGISAYLPFEALLSQTATDAENFSALPYLLKKYKLRYAYNLEILDRQMRQQAIQNNTFLALAPLYAAETVEHQPLGGAVKELELLASRYRGIFTFGEKIHKKQLLAALATKPAFVHLAAHAFAPDNSEAYLLLSAQKNEEEGRLWMREAALLPLENTALLVLSACQTGMGSNRKGEGLLSLGRAFAHSGATAMLTTLWPLHDHAAAALMQSFYQYLEQGLDKAEALRRAKLDFIEKSGALSAHPVFWASPLLWGNSQAISLPKASKFEKWSYLWAGGFLIALVLGAFSWFAYRKFLTIRKAEK